MVKMSPEHGKNVYLEIKRQCGNTTKHSFFTDAFFELTRDKPEENQEQNHLLLKKASLKKKCLVVSHPVGNFIFA